MIVIIDYGLGNVGSVANMLKKVGKEATVSYKPEVIDTADKIILPGVGAFDNGMQNLAKFNLIPVLNKKVIEDKIPILGICLGAQLFSKRSKEGELPGLGWLKAEIIRFSFDSTNGHLKIPHMVWNSIQIRKPNDLFPNLDDEYRFYFVHSYHFSCDHPEMILAETVYGYSFPSVVVKDNIVGAQFHPEKSHKFGMKLLKNFAERF